MNYFCPCCDQEYEVKTDFLNKKFTCQNCGHQIMFKPPTKLYGICVEEKTSTPTIINNVQVSNKNENTCKVKNEGEDGCLSWIIWIIVLSVIIALISH